MATANNKQDAIDQVSTPRALFGRSEEWDRFLHLLDQLDEGRSDVLFIEGEAGIGKSRLVEELRNEASKRRLSVFYGKAEELERIRPFGPLVQALDLTSSSSDTARAEIGRMIEGEPGASAPAPAASKFRASDGIVDLLESLGMAGPVALLLEDLHWADTGTITCVGAAVRRLSHLPVTIVATMRPLPRDPELESLLDASTRQGGTVMQLDSLDEAAISDLATQLLGGRPGPKLAAALAAVGGNPLFCLELCEALREEGSVQIEGVVAEIEQASLPPTLRLTILRRLSFLPPSTLEALQLASVLGAGFSVDELAAVMSRPVVDVWTALRPAIQAKIIAERGESLVFRHDLIHAAIYEDVPAPMRSSLHLEVAKALRDSGASAIRLAPHLLRASASERPEMVDLLTEAAGAAWDRSADIAARLYERALQLLPAHDDRRNDLVAAAVMPMIWSGRFSDAEALLRETSDRPQGEITLDPRIWMGSLTLRFLRGDPVRKIIEAIEGMLETPGMPEPMRGVALGFLSLTRGWSGDPQGALAAVQEMESIGFPGGPLAERTSLVTRAWVAAHTGRIHEALRSLEGAIAVERHAPGGTAIFSSQGLFLLEADRPEDARAALDEGRRHEMRMGQLASLPLYSFASALLNYLTGSWDDALADVETGERFVRDGVGGVTARSVGYACAIQIALHRGDLVGAERLTDEAEREVGGADFSGWYVSFCRAALLEARGNSAEALRRMEELWDSVESLRYLWVWRGLGPPLVRLCVAHGVLDRARTVTEQCEEAAHRADGVPSADGAALNCRGLVEDDPEVLLAAVAAQRKGPRVFERARTCEDAGTSLARHDRAAEARTMFEEALGLYEELGAVRAVTRATAAMRAAGLRRGSRARRQRPTVGWASLTPTEESVARLTVEGLTNPQIAERLFVSKYTVQTHLSHIFGKLGIASRVELAGLAAKSEA